MDSNKRRGLNLPQALGVLFIGLKLMGHIGWSWWLVTAPIWIWVIAVIITELLEENKELKDKGGTN